MHHLRFAVVGLIVALIVQTSFASDAVPLTAMARIPVKEITIFKDGHALLLHEGKMPTDADGNVLMDYLPAPVLGTFWPYCSQQNVKLTAVVAGQRRVSVSRTALNLHELIEANIGAEVSVTEVPASPADHTAPAPYDATILGWPTQSGQELEASSPPNTGDKLPIKGTVVLFKTGTGTKVVNIDRIQDISFKGEHKPVLSSEEFRNLLTLKLQWPDNKPEKEAAVGLLYLQKGVRWIPNYKVTIDGKGDALVKLQATIINELADLDDVSAHLVVGVPTFAFKDMVDPISLQQQIAQLGPYFDANAATANRFSNAIMSQSARMTESRAPSGAGEGAQPMDLGPEMAGSGKAEDLFIFNVDHLSLKKGQRIVMPVTEFHLSYKDVYSLDIPFAPPAEVMQNFNSEQQAELAKLLSAPKVIHKIRLANSSSYPLTTSPALITRDEHVLAQGMMTYTAVGADSDLDLTTAVDIKVKKTDQETRRTPNAAQWQREEYGRIDLAGKITLTNFGKLPVEVEVVRHVLGNVGTADDGGKAEMVNVLEDDSFPASRTAWSGWYAWPQWWSHFNGVGKITWDAKLESGKPVELNYTWSYYWR